MNQDITIDVRDLMRFLLRGLLPALTLGIVLGVVAYWWLANQEPVYSTRATVLASQPTSELRSFGVSLVAAPPLDASAYRIAGTSDPVVSDALRLLGTNEITQRDISRFKRLYTIRTEDTRTSSLMHIDASLTASPEAAAETANAVATALIEWDRGRARTNLARVIETLEQQIAALDEQIRSLQAQPNTPQNQIDSRLLLRAEQQQQLYNARALSSAVIGNLEVLQPAPPPQGRLPSSPPIGAAIAFLLGTLAVYGFMLLREVLDNRIQDVESLRTLTGLPVLAEFTRQKRRGRRLPAESASFLRTNVLFELGDVDRKVVLVTSAIPGDGKSSVSMSLAESFARNGRRTLLVDADLRSPAIATEYKVMASIPTLKTYLRSDDTAFRPARVSLDPSTSFDVVPAGETSSPATDLLAQGIRGFLEARRSSYEVIVIDTPPVTAVADALVVAPHCTGAVLVTNMHQARRPQLLSSIDVLKRTGVRVLGLVANEVTEEHTTQVYGYGYGAPQRR